MTRLGLDAARIRAESALDPYDLDDPDLLIPAPRLYTMWEAAAGLAREYVADRKLNISEAAYRHGFSEPSAFSRAFKRWTGMSPQAFRAIPQGLGR